MIQHIKQARKELWFVAICVFFAVNIVVRHSGSANAASRYALSLGMIANNTFSIDGFESMTCDWSQTPDGRYYSNKPPGPSILALPIAWVIDRLYVDRSLTKDEQFRLREQNRSSSLGWQAFFIQIIPCALIVIFMDRRLRAWGASESGRSFAMLGYLFGITPSLLQNTMFGHAMAANGILLAMILTLDRRLVGAGFWFGVALLADYGAAFVLPGLIFVWLRLEGGVLKKIFDLARGAVIPAIVWVWYHTISFGSPLVTSHKYLSPEWVDVPAEKNALWGIFTVVPNFDVAVKLLFGPERGLLFTQPWVLIALICGGVIMFFKTKSESFKNPETWQRLTNLTLVVYTSFIGLWIANSSFNGWHGGATIGPRYLSVALALFPLWVGLLFDRFPRTHKLMLTFGLVIAICFFGLAFSQDILIGSRPWEELIRQYYNRSFGMKFKVTLSAILVYWCALYYWRRSKTEIFVTS